MNILSDGISLFFPAYNEESNVAQTIETAVSVIKPFNCKYEIIVVDDGSTDKTAEIVSSYSKVNPNIVLRKHLINKGYGEALKTGFNSARYGFVFFSDCDLQFDLNELIQFIEALNQNKAYSGVIGYRIKRADPLMRKINSFGWKMWCRLLFGINFKDIDCAFKLFKKEAINGLNLESGGALISAEMLAKMKNRKIKILEKGVFHYPRKAGSQTGSKLSVIIRAFYESFKLFRRLRAERD